MGDGLPFIVIIRKTRMSSYLHKSQQRQYKLSYFKTMRLVPLSSFKFHEAKEIDEKLSFLCVCVNDKFDKSKRSFINGFLQFLEPGFI